MKTEPEDKKFKGLIQIQHLLKLNTKAKKSLWRFLRIQIQHLLKLNYVNDEPYLTPQIYSNTTLVKVK